MSHLSLGEWTVTLFYRGITVQKPSKLVHEPWFQEAIRDAPDYLWVYFLKLLIATSLRILTCILPVSSLVICRYEGKPLSLHLCLMLSAISIQKSLFTYLVCAIYLSSDVTISESNEWILLILFIRGAYTCSGLCPIWRALYRVSIALMLLGDWPLGKSVVPGKYLETVAFTS